MFRTKIKHLFAHSKQTTVTFDMWNSIQSRAKGVTITMKFPIDFVWGRPHFFKWYFVYVEMFGTLLMRLSCFSVAVLKTDTSLSHMEHL